MSEQTYALSADAAEFYSDRVAALREMGRVTGADGHLITAHRT